MVTYIYIYIHIYIYICIVCYCANWVRSAGGIFLSLHVSLCLVYVSISTQYIEIVQFMTINQHIDLARILTISQNPNPDK